MFLSRNKKNNVYPRKPQFYYIKVGFQGGQNYIGMFSWWVQRSSCMSYIKSNTSHFCSYYFSLIRYVRKSTFRHVRTVWSESSLSAWRNLKPFTNQNMPSEDSVQTVRMRSLIWIRLAHESRFSDVMTQSLFYFTANALSVALRKHSYSNILKFFSTKKMKIFRWTNSVILHISAQNIDCG